MNNLIVLTDFDFENPSGAGWNRIINYTKALALENINVHLVSSKYEYSSKFKNIPYQSNVTFYTGQKKNFKSTYADFHFRRYLKFIKLVYRNFSKKKNKNFLLYNSSFSSVITPLFYLLLIKREKVFIEKNELRTAISINLQFFGSGIITRIIWLLFKVYRILTGILTDTLTVFFSGIIVISTRIEKLFSFLNKRIIRIPILVDKNDILPSVHEDRTRFKIGYFGWIGEKKDGVFSLISVIEKISIIYPQIELHLYGNGTTKSRKKIKKISNNRNIFYHGSISPEEVKKNLPLFNLLALTRPKNLQTMYGFSTKLGEYLISGVPVLLTDISDNCLYLKDRKNSYVVSVSRKINKIELATKLKEIILNDTNNLLSIGKKGRETAIKFFNYDLYSKDLAQFLFNR